MASRRWGPKRDRGNKKENKTKTHEPNSNGKGSNKKHNQKNEISNRKRYQMADVEPSQLNETVPDPRGSNADVISDNPIVISSIRPETNLKSQNKGIKKRRLNQNSINGDNCYFFVFCGQFIDCVF